MCLIPGNRFLCAGAAATAQIWLSACISFLNRKARLILRIALPMSIFRWVKFLLRRCLLGQTVCCMWGACSLTAWSTGSWNLVLPTVWSKIINVLILMIRRRAADIFSIISCMDMKRCRLGNLQLGQTGLPTRWGANMGFRQNCPS